MKRLLPILLLVFSVGVGAETIEYEGGAYAGKLVDGVTHSQGTYTFAGGDKYVGEWKAGKMYGEGAYTHADGTETLGGWKFGCPWNAVVYDSAGKLKSSYKDGVPQ